MTESKITLENNPRAYLEQYMLNLQSDSKALRRRALINIQEEIFENTRNAGCDRAVVFPEVYAYILKSFSDESESCRETAISIISNFIDHLPLNDYYLTYILPVIVRRIGCPEIVEESEEIRLVLIQLVHKIITKYKGAQYLTTFLNDFTSILTKTSTDPFPKVKIEACECIIQLSKTMHRDFHMQAESYVKPIVSNFAHQHFRVRVAAVRAIGAIVMVGNYKCFELSITPMAEKLFDENTQVRLQVTMEVGNWMLSYRDRYSFWHKMIPLLLTSLSDIMADVRVAATDLWNDIGLQYMEENEEDLKKKTDFLKDVPTHYPDVKRPNLGCRALVQCNIGKIVPAIGREMEGWQADARLRSSQLLCWLLLCAEEGSTQHSNVVVKILLRGAADDDARVVQEIKRASELFGYFITPDLWWPLLEADLDSWCALFVIANVISGSRADLVQEVMGRLCKELADPDKCRTRKKMELISISSFNYDINKYGLNLRAEAYPCANESVNEEIEILGRWPNLYLLRDEQPKYQRNLLQVCESLMVLCGAAISTVAEQLFIINFTVYAMPSDEKIRFMAFGNLDKLRHLSGCGASIDALYERYIHRVLSAITGDPLTWTLLSPDCALLDCVMLHAGSVLGSNLHLLAPLLKETLGVSKVDPEVKLKIFTALSTVLLQRRKNFSKCDQDKLEAFLKIVIKELILPNIVWSPGRTAEATRTAAVACLCAALQDDVTQDGAGDVIQVGGGDVSRDGGGNRQDEVVKLFPTKESLEPFLEEMVPLLVGLADDNSALTRQHTLRAICSLAALAHKRDCFSAEVLHKLYFVVLKRLDDCTCAVRSGAAQTLPALFSRRPHDYDTCVYGAHVDALYAAMLVHLDDVDDAFRGEMLDALLKVSNVDPRLLMKKVMANIHLYRNKAAYEKLRNHLETMIK